MQLIVVDTRRVDPMSEHCVMGGTPMLMFIDESATMPALQVDIGNQCAARWSAARLTT
jgi:hypothetical protein